MPASQSLIARNFATGDWVRVTIEGSTLSSVDPHDGPARIDDLDPWIAPAFWDLQVNGRWGVSFSDPEITADEVIRIVRSQAPMGVSRFCPTLITASPEATLRGVQTIAEACRSEPEIDRRILGIHLEGPWISPEEGYRGAHPRESVRDPDWSEFLDLQRASGSRIVLVTLAPERSGGIDFVKALCEAGVVVAIAHSEADGPTISAASRAGLRLATHLGNGVPANLPRHPNTVWSQAANEALWASFIVDGCHLDDDALRVLFRSKRDQALLVTDASPLAGSPPGRYGPWEVREDGRIVVAGTPYLAGANVAMAECVDRLIRTTETTATEAVLAATRRPALVLGHVPPELAAGNPSDLILFRLSGEETDRRFHLMMTSVGGEWSIADQAV